MSSTSPSIRTRKCRCSVRRGAGNRERITIHAENYGQPYTIAEPCGCYGKHPLLEAAFDYMHIPGDVAIEVSIFSEAPGGCSTGTSAAVSVALIGALDSLTPGRMSPHEVAAAAQRIETELLKQQCGIQDQIASAFGGINYIEMHQLPARLGQPDPHPGLRCGGNWRAGSRWCLSARRTARRKCTRW